MASSWIYTCVAVYLAATGYNQCALGEIAESEPRYSSRINCSADMMDVLFLFFNKGGFKAARNQMETAKEFSNHLAKLHANKTTLPVMLAAVYDRFSALDPNVNVTDWNFHSDYGIKLQGQHSLIDKKQEYKDLQETIDLKVNFVRRLFSEMGEVRKNVSHVAVIFLDGRSLSEEESRNVPKFKEQLDESIRIFLIVIGGIQSSQIENEFPLSKFIKEKIYSNILVMQICSQCPRRFFPFKHSVGGDSFSCYILVKMVKYTEMYRLIINEMVDVSICHVYGAFPVHIASQEELSFLQSRLKSEFYNRDKHSTRTVSIGLLRSLKGSNGRFDWLLTYPFRFRPLVMNNWLVGKPSLEHDRNCAMWKFEWRDQGNNLTTISNNRGYFVDGWTDIECEREAEFVLCEVAVTNELEDKDLMKINPATSESFNKILAKGDFRLFQNNIVSVSTHIADINFRKVLTEAKFELFPLFDCGDNAGEFRYISYMLVCDSINDCSNKKDEMSCPNVKTGFTLFKKDIDCRRKCKGIYCCSGMCLPLIYDNDGQVACDVCLNIEEYKGFDESDVLDEYMKTNESKAFICYIRKCVYSSELTYNMSKCHRPDKIEVEIRRTDITCPNNLGYSFWAPTCVYIKDRYSTILDCRRMSHLENCKDFVCPEGYVKCPNTYCIPQHYVLDGKEDCPTGEDERINNTGTCTGNFACWDSRVCLHPDLVCDGHPDCPHLDDEIDCNEACAEGFRCVSGTVTVTNYTTARKNLTNQSYSKARYINYSNLNLSNIFNHTLILHRLIFIDWSNCSLKHLKVQFKYPAHTSMVQTLDVSYNSLQEIDGSVIDFIFYNLRQFNLSHNKELVFINNINFQFLETLDLSYTGLSNLGQMELRGLPNLKHLDLSFTLISSFDGKINFPINFFPQTLNVRGLPIDNFYEDFFTGLSVSHHLHTDRFELCCPQIRGPNIPSHVCHAPEDAISSCFDLIGIKVQRVLLWVFAVLAVLGNTTVIVYRLICDRSSLKTGFGLFVTNLGISDFIMGVYLFIIAVAHYYYRGVYVLYDKIWRESFACKFAGFLATLSSEASTFFVFLITLDRFLMMKFPAGQIKFYEKGKMIAIPVSWILGLIVALIPIVFKLEIYSSNAVCLGLPLATKRTKGWEFSFSVFIVLNFLLFLIIVYGQRAIFLAMSMNRLAGSASKTSSRRIQDIRVAKQLTLIALSNFLCWFPVGIMGLLSIGGHETSNDVYAWTTVIVLPINSAANPLLYTIPILMDKWQKFKFRDTFSRRKRT